MHKVTALRAAVIIGSSMFLSITSFMSTTIVADAAPRASDNPQLGVGELPVELVQAVERDLHISASEYLDRAARAQQLGDYARQFRAERPESFAGAWMGTDGHAVVAVTSNEAAKIAENDGYRSTLAPISADGLERSLAELNRWVAALPRELSRNVNSIAMDVLNNQLVIDIANSPAGKLLNLPTVLANVQVILSPGGGGPVEQRPMAGDSYISTRGPLPQTPLAEIVVCSFGFNAIDGSGRPINISAGHCDPNVGGNGNAPVYLPNPADVDTSPQIGSFAYSSLGDPAGLDYSVISLNNSAVTAGLDQPNVRGANGTTLTVTGTAQPVIGAPVCKSGQTSTFTCGIVAADRVETLLFSEDGSNRIVHGFASTACTLAGDSGGAIVSGTLAVGITSGSNASAAPNCETANMVLAPDGGTASLGIPIRDILADANATSVPGITLRTNRPAA